MSPFYMSDDDRPEVFSVYRCYSADNRALYIGFTGRGANRLKQHSLTPWWSEVAAIGVEHFANEADALEHERQLIDALRPVYNRPLRAIPEPPEVPAAPPVPEAA